MLHVNTHYIFFPSYLLKPSWYPLKRTFISLLPIPFFRTTPHSHISLSFVLYLTTAPQHLLCPEKYSTQAILFLPLSPCFPCIQFILPSIQLISDDFPFHYFVPNHVTPSFSFPHTLYYITYHHFSSLPSYRHNISPFSSLILHHIVLCCAPFVHAAPHSLMPISAKDVDISPELRLIEWDQGFNISLYDVGRIWLLGLACVPRVSLLLFISFFVCLRVCLCLFLL